MISAAFKGKTQPLIHSITNYVTANDVANAILAVGGAPIMADSPKETAEITGIADALNLNLGTPSRGRIRAMLRSGRAASKKGIPILLDLVGAGASGFRKRMAKRLIKRLSPDIIKGNVSELGAVISGGNSRGVDAFSGEGADIEMLRAFAKKNSAVIVATGREDIITDGEAVYMAENGSQMMSRITGTGCMLSGVLAVLAAENAACDAALAGVMLFGIAGERAEARMKKEDGNGSYRLYLADELSRITSREVEEYGKYEIIRK